MKMKSYLGSSLFFIVCFSYSQTISYTSHVRPIFVKYGCINCHGGSGDLFLETYAQVFTTGLHVPVVIPNDANSILIQKLKGTTRFGDRMPQGGDPVSDAELDTIIQWIMTGAPENSTTFVADKVRVATIPTFELKQNYPNPFNPSTIITFHTPRDGFVSLKVFDILGKEVAMLVNNYKETGRYSVEFDASRLSSGMYIYKLTSDKFSEVKKMMLVK